MKSLYFGCGILWLVAFLAMALRPFWSWWLTLIAAFATLCFVPFGTLSSVIVIILLLSSGRTLANHQFSSNQAMRRTADDGGK